MRRLGKLCLVLAVAVLVTGLAEAQQRGGRGGRGGFGGGFGGRGGPGGGGVQGLIQNRQVREELKITEEQLKKLPDAYLAALKSILTEKQFARLNQIQFQRRGGAVLRDPKIQEKLALDAAQKDDLNTLYTDLEKAVKEAGRDFRKRATLTNEANKRALTVLTSAQKKIYDDLTGPEFKFQTFGGTGGTGRTGGGRGNFVERYDKDKNGALSKEELKAVPEFLRNFLTRGDTNKDGALDAAELKKLTESFGRGRGGRGTRGRGGRPGAGRPGGAGGGGQQANRPKRPGGN